MTSKSHGTDRNPRTPSDRPSVDVPRWERSVAGIPEEAVLTPITEISHLAEAAKRLGHTDRQVWVDRPEPQKVQTPGREPGQWLGCGERLPDPCPCTKPPRRDRPPSRPEWEGFDR